MRLCSRLAVHLLVGDEQLLSFGVYSLSSLFSSSLRFIVLFLSLTLSIHFFFFFSHFYSSNSLLPPVARVGLSSELGKDTGGKAN